MLIHVITVARAEIASGSERWGTWSSAESCPTSWILMTLDEEVEFEVATDGNKDNWLFKLLCSSFRLSIFCRT